MGSITENAKSEVIGYTDDEGNQYVRADVAGIKPEFIKLYEAHAKELGLDNPPPLFVNVTDKGGEYGYRRTVAGVDSVVVNAAGAGYEARINCTLDYFTGTQPAIKKEKMNLVDAHFASSVSRDLRTPEENAVLQRASGDYPDLTTAYYNISGSIDRETANVIKSVQLFDSLKQKMGVDTSLCVDTNNHSKFSHISYETVDGKERVVINMMTAGMDADKMQAVFEKELSIVKSHQHAQAHLQGANLTSLKLDSGHDGVTVSVPTTVTNGLNAVVQKL